MGDFEDIGDLDYLSYLGDQMDDSNRRNFCYMGNLSDMGELFALGGLSGMSSFGDMAVF